MKSECLVAVVAVLLSSQSVVAEPEHGGRGGGHGGGRGGGHGGGFGFHRRGGHPYGPWMYPYPPPMLPYPAPLPMVPAGGLAIGTGIPVGFAGAGAAASRISMPNYPLLDGLGGIGPMFDDSISGYEFSDWRGNNRNLAASQAGQAGQAGAFTAHASSNFQAGGSADREPMRFVAQAPSFAGQVTSSRFNVASNLGGSASRSARMLNQGAEGLQIEVDGQGAMPEPPQGQMPLPPPMPMPPPPMSQPPMQQPAPMPPQPQGGLVTKGFVRKAESFQEQKSGSKQSSKEYEKTTTPI